MKRRLESDVMFVLFIMLDHILYFMMFSVYCLILIFCYSLGSEDNHNRIHCLKYYVVLYHLMLYYDSTSYFMIIA